MTSTESQQLPPLEKGEDNTIRTEIIEPYELGKLLNKIITYIADFQLVFALFDPDFGCWSYDINCL